MRISPTVEFLSSARPSSPITAGAPRRPASFPLPLTKTPPPVSAFEPNGRRTEVPIPHRVYSHFEVQVPCFLLEAIGNRPLSASPQSFFLAPSLGAHFLPLGRPDQVRLQLLPIDLHDFLLSRPFSILRVSIFLRAYVPIFFPRPVFLTVSMRLLVLVL